jgi:hypothetical protein
MKEHLIFFFNFPLILLYRTLIDIEFYNTEEYQHRINSLYYYTIEKDWFGLTLISMNFYYLLII